MKNLVIGNTSQLSYYFPNTYTKISSRNIDLKDLQKTKWDSVYICFAEQRTYIANSEDISVRESFWNTNYSKVLEVIDALQGCANRIVYYSTAELWNKLTGPISADIEYSYHSNSYTDSKCKISTELRNKQKYPKVVIGYPFNFNSIYRKSGYLFSEIFDSILNNLPISIGDVDYYREILHPQMVVDMSMNLDKDAIIGSGRVIHIGDFIRSLYCHFSLNPDEMISYRSYTPSSYRNFIFYSHIHRPQYGEDVLFALTVKELKQKKEFIYHERNANNIS